MQSLSCRVWYYHQTLFRSANVCYYSEIFFARKPYKKLLLNTANFACAKVAGDITCRG